jgi:flagellar basal-body rod protein FlgB
MINSLLTNPTTAMLEQTVSFTEQRHNVLVADIANASTPGYVQKDLSVEHFQAALRKAISRTNASGNEAYRPESTDEVSFDEGGGVEAQAMDVPTGVAFHDGGVRSMEYLMSQMADNALAHNMAAQFLKQRFDQVARAISMKV